MIQLINCRVGVKQRSRTRFNNHDVFYAAFDAMKYLYTAYLDSNQRYCGRSSSLLFLLRSKCIHTSQQSSIYFKTPRKYSLGICAEFQPQQINYLTAEEFCTGKGSNETISYLHHILDNCQIKSNQLNFLSDNCNWNNVVVQYICWRTAEGKDSI